MLVMIYSPSKANGRAKSTNERTGYGDASACLS